MNRINLERRIRAGLKGSFQSGDFSIGHGSLIKGNIQVGKNVKIGNGCYIISEKEKVVIGDKVNIHDGVIIGEDVAIGNGCTLGSGTHIVKNTRIGDGNSFYNCSIGSEPQGRFERQEKTFLFIGDYNEFREYSVVNRGSILDDRRTVIGNKNMILSQTHIGHDCKIGNDNVIISGSLLAGHVHIGNNARVSGLSGIAQFVHVGDYAFIGGQSGVRGNVLPYSRVDGRSATLRGINVNRMKSMYYDKDDFDRIYGEIKEAYTLVKNKSLSDERLARTLKNLGTEPAMKIAYFIENVSERNKKLLRSRTKAFEMEEGRHGLV